MMKNACTNPFFQDLVTAQELWTLEVVNFSNSLAASVSQRNKNHGVGDPSTSNLTRSPSDSHLNIPPTPSQTQLDMNRQCSGSSKNIAFNNGMFTPRPIELLAPPHTSFPLGVRTTRDTNNDMRFLARHTDASNMTESPRYSTVGEDLNNNNADPDAFRCVPTRGNAFDDSMLNNKRRRSETSLEVELADDSDLDHIIIPDDDMDKSKCLYSFQNLLCRVLSFFYDMRPTP